MSADRRIDFEGIGRQDAVGRLRAALAWHERRPSDYRDDDYHDDGAEPERRSPWAVDDERHDDE